MSGRKVSANTEASSLASTDKFLVARPGTSANYKASPATVRKLLVSNMANGDVLTFAHSETPYSTSTITIVDGVVTLSTAPPYASAEFPSWAADGDLIVGGQLYSVNTRDSITQLTLDDLTVDVAAGTSYSLQKADLVPQNPRWKVLPSTSYTAAPPTIAITAASNTTPIVITAANHKLKTGEHVTISGCVGNTAANGTFEVDAKTQRITNATAANPVVITTEVRHGYCTGDKVNIIGVRGTTVANNTVATPSHTITVITDFTFSLNGVNGTSSSTFDTDSFAQVSLADQFEIYTLGPDSTAKTTITSVVNNLVTTASPHGLSSNTYVTIQGVASYDGANGDTWLATVTGASTFTINYTGTGSGTGGTVVPSFANKLNPVAGTGAYTSGGTMIKPGELTINATTESEANRLGFYIGGALKMVTASGTSYGVITALPGQEGYPYQRPSPTLPNLEANKLTYAGHPLTASITSLAVGPSEMIQCMPLVANSLAHYGSKTDLPIYQLAQGTPEVLVDKWKNAFGANVLGYFGRSLAHWYGGNANLVAFQVAQRKTGNTDVVDSLGFFSGGTVTIIPDHQRPTNSSGVHTDGSAKYGALVTKSSNLSAGDAVTGIKGWRFSLMNAGASTAVDGATDDSPIVITAVAHPFSNDHFVAVQNVSGNTAANGTWVVKNKTANTFELYRKDGTASSGNGAYTSGGTVAGAILETTHCVDGGTGTDFQTEISSASSATPIVVTCTSHGLTTGQKITISGVTGNAAANATHYVTRLTADTFSLYSDSTLATPVAGVDSGTGGYFTNGLAATQCVVESMTMTASAGSRYEHEDVETQPFINIDIGGQLVSPANGYRGMRAHPYSNALTYIPPTEINPLSSDVIYNSRIEIACCGIGNRPGAVDATTANSSCPQYLTAFLVFVLE